MPFYVDKSTNAAHRQRVWVLNPATLTKGASGCFEIGKANLASHLRRAIGADVEACDNPEERVQETTPEPAKGSGIKGIKKGMLSQDDSLKTKSI